MELPIQLGHEFLGSYIPCIPIFKGNKNKAGIGSIGTGEHAIASKRGDKVHFVITADDFFYFFSNSVGTLQ